MSKSIGVIGLCVTALTLTSCGLLKKPARLSDVPPPPAQATIECAPAPVLPLPATDKAMAQWVIQSEVALSLCELKRRALQEAWPVR